MKDMKLLYEKAQTFATKKHRGQVRKFSGLPYITHPQAVAESLKPYGLEYRIVGILHDVLEDTDATVQDLIDLGLNCEVIDAVKALTKMEHETYLEFILRVKENDVAKKVKHAGITHNMSDLKPGSMRDKYEMGLYILRGV